MRGRLLASSSLIAAATLAAAPAFAQTAFMGPGSPAATTQSIPPASAASPAVQTAAGGPRFVIRLGGFFTEYFSVLSQDDRGTTTVSATPATTTGPAITSPVNNASAVNFAATSEIRFTITGAMALDNGFVPGFVLEIQNLAGLAPRRMFGFLQSARFGEVHIGLENNAIDALLVREPNLWRGFTSQGFFMSNAFRKLVLNPSGSGFGNTVFGDVESFIGGVTRADEAFYITPRIQGLQLGVSFAPEQSSRDEASQIPLTNGTGASYRNVWTVAANYQWTFPNGFVIRAGGGTQWASPPDQAGFGASIGSPAGVGGGAGAGTPRIYQGGIQLGYRGLTLGGAFNRMQNVRVLGTAGSTTATAPAFPNVTVSDGLVWIASGVYQYGPYAIGVTYFDARNSDCSTTALTLGACGSRDRMTAIALLGSYQLGPGIYWESSLFRLHISGNDWNNGTFVGTAPLAGGAIATTATGAAQRGLQSNTATGFVTGLAIVF